MAHCKLLTRSPTKHCLLVSSLRKLCTTNYVMTIVSTDCKVAAQKPLTIGANWGNTSYTEGNRSVNQHARK